MFKGDKKQKKQTSGITLVALVVTIVVLLILAGITITLIFSDSGIINKVREAAEKTKNSIANDQSDMTNLANQIENLVGGGKKPDTSTKLADVKGTPVTETTEVTDDDGDKMWVPKDFTVTEGDKIDEGVVVKDPKGNEFVWVPVDNIYTMVYCQAHSTATNNIEYDDAGKKLVCTSCKTEEKTTNFAGKLYENSGTFSASKESWTFSSSGYREPDKLSSYDDNDANFNSVKDGNYENFKAQLQDEFNKMAASVWKYKGFYIGRYETSGLESGTPIVKPNQPPTTATDGTNWYTMYTNSKNLGSSEVTSSMIWGCQWDQVMLWMQGVENPTVPGAKYITNSSGMGWYYGEKGIDDVDNSNNLTGVDLKKEIEGKQVVTNRVKNIYDLAGNMYEWTLEAYNTGFRVGRGGGYYDSGSDYPAIDRSNYGPDVSNYNLLSSRVALYVK